MKRRAVLCNDLDSSRSVHCASIIRCSFCPKGKDIIANAWYSTSGTRGFVPEYQEGYYAERNQKKKDKFIKET